MKRMLPLAVLLAAVAPGALVGTTDGGRDGVVRGVSVNPAADRARWTSQ